MSRATKYRTKSERERFERKFTKHANGCWMWTACVSTNGYGKFAMEKPWREGMGKLTISSRASWRIYRGEIPEGMNVLHRCDVPLCVNPDHLFLGTQAENMADMCAKGRHFWHRPKLASLEVPECASVTLLVPA